MKQLQSGQHFGAPKKAVLLPGVVLTEAGYTPGIDVPWHYHENAYFYYHLHGRLDEVNKKESLTCIPGTLLFHHWQDPHYDKKFSQDALFFHIELENNWFSRHHLKPGQLAGSMQLENPVLKSNFKKIYKESKINDNITQIAIDGLLLQSFASILRQSKEEKSGIPGWVRKVKEILHNSENEKITLQQLSVETGLHPVHLSKAFPKYFNTGFEDYIRNIKVEKATTLLADNTLSLPGIAYSCGFSDQSHFIRCFKAAYGITPLQYRNKVCKR